MKKDYVYDNIIWTSLIVRQEMYSCRKKVQNWGRNLLGLKM